MNKLDVFSHEFLFRAFYEYYAPMVLSALINIYMRQALHWTFGVVSLIASYVTLICSVFVPIRMLLSLYAIFVEEGEDERRN